MFIEKPLTEQSLVFAKERHFVVGTHCSIRLQLYHALWHYKHRLRAKLKKQLKIARKDLQVTILSDRLLIL